MKMLVLFLLTFTTTAFAYEMNRADAVQTIRHLQKSNIATLDAMGVRFISLTKVVCAAKNGKVACRATERFTGKRKVLKNPTWFFRILLKAGLDSFTAASLECEHDDQDEAIADASCTIKN